MVLSAVLVCKSRLQWSIQPFVYMYCLPHVVVVMQVAPRGASRVISALLDHSLESWCFACGIYIREFLSVLRVSMLGLVLVYHAIAVFVCAAALGSMAL